MEKCRTIKRYGPEPEFTRKTDEPYRINVDPDMTDDLFLNLCDEHDRTNPIITIIFKPENISGKKTIHFNATDSNGHWDIKFGDGVKFDRVIMAQK
jgi:hypothetical protein